LIDAMGLLLGERASTEVIRKGAARSVVEGIFNVESNKKVKKIIEENELEVLPELIVRREISLKGANRCFVNDTPVPLSVIKDLGDLLVDLHGQHEHQSLLRTETHINFLDEYAGVGNLIEEYETEFKNIKALNSELNELKKKEAYLKEKKDFYSFQIKEIDAVSPAVDEEEQIQNDLNILEHSEKLIGLTTEIYESLFEAENSVYDQLMQIKNRIDELLIIDNNFSEIENEFSSVIEQVKDAAEFIRKYNSKTDLDPQHLEELRERLGAVSLLKKKYGGSVEAVIEYRKKIGEEFEAAENYAGNILKLEEKISAAHEKAGLIAEKLSLKRKEAAKKVEKEIVKILAGLGISEPKFEIQLTHLADEKDSGEFITLKGKKINADSNGIDRVEFFISTNPGENLKPLIKVASGGEVSRIMLSLKTALAKNERLPLLIFDEIDTGVSGRIAQKVGNALKSLASSHQVIAITHLPQIAGTADSNYAVEKKTMGERVISSIKKLNEEEKIREIAKLISGENITETSINSAKELMGLN
ncbi:MAG TPA: DNA repair protein RecN, partial [Ignavibacteriaceae bacterium]|nr:DNA repair protein RecN [Ignavibacteriaceae bacterium]